MTCKLVNICLINRCVTLFWICCWWSKMKLCEGSPPSTKWEFWHSFIYKFAAILMICRSASGSPHIVRRPKYSALHYLGSRLASAGRRGLRSLWVIRGCDAAAETRARKETYSPSFHIDSTTSVARRPSPHQPKHLYFHSSLWHPSRGVEGCLTPY